MTVIRKMKGCEIVSLIGKAKKAIYAKSRFHGRLGDYIRPRRS